MRFHKIAALFAALILMFSVSAGAVAEGIVIGGLETADSSTSTDDASAAEQVSTSGESTSESTVLPEATAAAQPEVTAAPAATAQPVTDGTNLTPEGTAASITKHPGSEYNHAVGDSVVFYAACTSYSGVNWYFNTSSASGIPISSIGSYFSGMSSGVESTTYNGVNASKLSVYSLTKSCSGIEVYAEFSTAYGILKSDAAKIEVTVGKDPEDAAAVQTAAPVPTPTTEPTLVPAETPVPAASLPAQTDAGAVFSTETVTGTEAIYSDYVVEDSYASDYNTDQTLSADAVSYREITPWVLPGAGAAVVGCVITAAAALILMALYSAGIIRLRGLEELVTDEDEDMYDED